MALGHIGLYKIPIEKKGDVTKKNTKIYPNIYKYMQDIQDIYKIPDGGQGPAPRRRRLVFCIYLVYLVYFCIYICVYFNIFRYIWCYSRLEVRT